MDKNRSGSSRHGFNMGNVIGDPFALATISIATLAWIIAFLTSIVAQVQSQFAFPAFSWWTITYYLCVIAGVFVTVVTDTAQTYHVALVGYLACGLVLTTSSVNSLIYLPNSAMQAAAAGFILLSMVTVVWIFYFGSAPSALPRAYLDSFALDKDSRANHRLMNGLYGAGRPETSVSAQPPQMYTSAQLNGLENSSLVGAMPTSQTYSSPANMGSSSPKPTDVPTSVTPALTASDAGLVPPTEYPYYAKAIYSYDANPDDSNEISFTKHEILGVSDVGGRWWQARKPNGETGIAPSNYLILL